MRYLLLLLPFTFAIGCTADRQSELLEARLRSQQDQMIQLTHQLERSEADLSVAKKESDSLRAQLASTGKPVLQPEQADVLYRIAKLQIDEYQSAILLIGDSGQQMINLVLTPVDQFDEPLKLPGEISLRISTDASADASAVGGSGSDDPASKTHYFTASDVQKRWNSGWVSSGFVVQLPLPEGLTFNNPGNKQVTLAATFKTTDGREFHATQKLKIKRNSKKQAKTTSAKVVSSPRKFGVKQTTLQQSKLREEPIDTSDRRTIDEFPIFR